MDTSSESSRAVFNPSFSALSWWCQQDHCYHNYKQLCCPVPAFRLNSSAVVVFQHCISRTVRTDTLLKGPSAEFFRVGNTFKVRECVIQKQNRLRQSVRLYCDTVFSFIWCHISCCQRWWDQQYLKPSRQEIKQFKYGGDGRRTGKNKKRGCQELRRSRSASIRSLLSQFMQRLLKHFIHY